MKNITRVVADTLVDNKMALTLILLLVTCATAFKTSHEMSLMNVTRFAAGDLFSLYGTDCGLTRCMEASHGTAMAALGGLSCVCQCNRDTPSFREDQRTCVNHILECPMASFGRGSIKPQIPFVFLPLKGQIIYPSKEIVFTDIEDAVCAVTSAQYLSPSGWVTLRDVVDNDVPFGLYRDEGNTYLQWRGSTTLHSRLEGRLVAVHVLCSAAKPAYLTTSCAAFRIAGSSRNADFRSIPFHAGEMVPTEPATFGHGLSVLESLAIGVCVLLLVFVYAAGIIFYVHYKQRQKRKYKDAELNLSNTMSTDNGSIIDSRINMGNTVIDNVNDNIILRSGKELSNIRDHFQRIKNNPLLSIDSIRNAYMRDAGLSDVSEQTEDTLEPSPKLLKERNSNIVSAMVHTRHNNQMRPTSTPERISERLQRRSASPEIEKAPHSDLSILDCSLDIKATANVSPVPNGEPRRKLYFNPVFFETDHLKNPPPAAIEFLVNLREVMLIAKEKMRSKKFVPVLSNIPEEDLYHSLDLGWDIPCARRGRRFSVISLKRENSRRAVHCGGCPGCDSSGRSSKANGLSRSNSCKTCASDEYKQKIVQKWLDDVPQLQAKKPIKSVAKVSGTPRTIETKDKEEERTLRVEYSRPISRDLFNLNLSHSVKKQFKEARAKDNGEVEKENLNITKYEKEVDKSKEGNHTLFQNITSPINERKSPSNHATRLLRTKLPPPPPPPMTPPMSPPPMMRPTSPPPMTPPMSPPVSPSPSIARQSATHNQFTGDDRKPIIVPVIKNNMKAVICELNKCNRNDSEEIYANSSVIPRATPRSTPKLVISVPAPETQYYSDDNLLLNRRPKNGMYQNVEEFDSFDRSQFKRRFSLAYPTEWNEKDDFENVSSSKMSRERLCSSWRDVNKLSNSEPLNLRTNRPLSNTYVENNHANNISNEPLYCNVAKPGPLTIKVTGSPIYQSRKSVDNFDPDTLDRKPKKAIPDYENTRPIEKISLRSAGSFKHKFSSNENQIKCSPPADVFTRKIGSLRQLYEEKTKSQDSDMRLFYGRRGSVPNIPQEATSYVHFNLPRNPEDKKPPLPPKQKKNNNFSTKSVSTTGSPISDKHQDFSIKISSTRGSPISDRQRSSEERDKFPPNLRSDSVSTRRSGRRSNRTRPRRIDIKKLCRTEDSGYLSTDSNESKQKTKYMIQMRPKFSPPVTLPKPILPPHLAALHMESDTDDFESMYDGRSESGGESIETDSVFFGNFNGSKKLMQELRIDEYPDPNFIRSEDFLPYRDMNIILSGDSDSEHKSIISILAGRDGRASSASITHIDDSSYLKSIEC